MKAVCVLIWAVALLFLLAPAGCRSGDGDYYKDIDQPGDDTLVDDDQADDDSDDDDVDDDDDTEPFSPPAVWGAVYGYDAETGTLYVFGGATDVGGSMMSRTLWALAETGDGFRAREVEATGDAPPGLIHAAGAYDGATRTLLVFGGWSEEGAAAGGLWLCDLSQSPAVWTAPAFEGPGPRWGAGGIVRALEEGTGFTVLGGILQDSYLADQWLLSPVGDAGAAWEEEVYPLAAPSARGLFTFLYDANEPAAWLFGGEGPGGLLGDVWKFNATPGSEEWRQFPESADAPYARVGMAADADLDHARAAFFGGGEFDNTLYVLNLDTASQYWLKPEVTGTLPPGRRFAILAWDAAGGRFWLYGGQGDGTVYGDLWTIPADTLAGWTEETIGGE